MRIHFYRGRPDEFVAEFEVTREPTKSECDAIYGEIYASMNAWEEEHGNLDGFDFWVCCYNALNKYVPIVYNPVKTFCI